ncbi:MAG: carbohydrate ABC transporter permease [Sphaerochaetaceae bacterium]|nr:carbohydrate ABC transporter permease [Sphaerochaetaceae bacterium]MDC7237891.1 carbohydrate ABC transporter permease [Sphaerochaetaceae bacterium]MDC7250099.1 carbohydrate ABC transporter permease [Sphaerochaetaceae bacterium]
MSNKNFDKVNPLRFVLIIIAALIAIFPFLWMVQNSFNTEQNIFSKSVFKIPDLLFKSNMFENYQLVIGKYNFGRYTLNSVFVCGLASIGQVIICTLGGFVFARMSFKGSKVVFTLLLITLMVPVQVTIIPEYYIMMKLNWLDTFLPLIVPSFLAGAFGTFMLKEYFEQIPDALLDAGIIDGANAWKMYLHIFLPQCSAPAATLFIIAFMNNWNDLLRPMLYLTKESLYTVTLGLTQFQSQYSAKWNLLLTGSVLSILPLVIVFIFAQKYIIEGSISSGIKG